MYRPSTYALILSYRWVSLPARNGLLTLFSAEQFMVVIIQGIFNM